MKRFFVDDSAATAVEYALISGAMAAMLVAAFPSISSAITSQYLAIGARMAK